MQKANGQFLAFAVRFLHSWADTYTYIDTCMYICTHTHNTQRRTYIHVHAHTWQKHWVSVHTHYWSMHTYIYTYTPEKDSECLKSNGNRGGVCPIHTCIHTYTYIDTCKYICTHTHNTKKRAQYIYMYTHTWEKRWLPQILKL